MHESKFKPTSNLLQFTIGIYLFLLYVTRSIRLDFPIESFIDKIQSNNELPYK